MLTNFVFLMSVLAVASAQMSRTCYQGGTQGASECSQFVVDFCTDAAQDVLRVGNSNSRCYNTPSGQRCDFVSLNTRKVTAHADSPNCQAVLNNIIQNCPSGGYGLPGPVDYYTFTVDPNAGSCSRDIQPGN